MTVFHPKPDDRGRQVPIRKPDTPSDQASWQDPNCVAIATPGCLLPDRIGDVELKPWDAPQDAADWEALVAGLDFHEPPMPTVSGKEPAAGAVVIEPDGRIWLVGPTNQYGGYARTFPKGRTGKMSTRATAIKEAWEETGLKVGLTGFLCDSERSTTITRYYIARRVGGTPAAMGWETQSVVLAPIEALPRLATHPNDALLVSAAQKRSIVAYEFGLASGHRMLDALAGYFAKFGEWPTVIRMPAEMATGLQDTVLTPRGWELLNDRLKVISDGVSDVCAEGENRQTHRYDMESSLALYAKASLWIWGIDLSVYEGD